MLEPLATLSPSKQNARMLTSPANATPNILSPSSSKLQHRISNNNTDHENSVRNGNMASHSIQSSPAAEYHTTSDFPSTSQPIIHQSPQSPSPLSGRSPVKYRLQDDTFGMSSPPDSPAESTSTLRFNEGLTRAVTDMRREAEAETGSRTVSADYTMHNEDMSSIPREGGSPTTKQDPNDVSDFDITLGLDNTINNDTVGDLSTISAIPTDLTRFANLRSSPLKNNMDGISPTKSYRNSIAMGTPASGQRPLQLLSRRSTSSNEDEEQTPRRPKDLGDSPVDLMNFTGQTNIHIPPPGSAPRTARRSPSGRGAFPIRVNPTPSHRSQASVDRERASGRSPQKLFPDQPVPATPASHRHSMHVSGRNGLGMDLLDIDFEPMATPRSIPTVTPRELETLRSELQSRISSLEATLSGKEAEVSALKRAVTDAEVRAGKASEDLRTEQSEKDHLLNRANELESRAREMEDVLREVKQNAFVEERERDKLRRQAEDADFRAEECEIKILELNASLETLRSERVRGSPSPVKHSQDVPCTPGSIPASATAADIDHAVKSATETVARELHALYKSKHERKVADLKLSYEKRWAKQVEALKADLKNSQDEISRLITEKDGYMSGVIPGQSEAVSRMEGQIEELRRYNDDLNAQKKVVEAENAGIRSQLDAVQRENDNLRVEVEAERVEKGDLVAQVDMFLSLSAEQEVEREREKAEREARERERQPVSPPRSDTSGDSFGGTTAQQQTPQPPGSAHKARPSLNAGRPRPMSMLAKPTAGKFGSGIPGPGASGLKAPSTAGTRPGVYGRTNLMDGIARMGR